MKLRAMVLAVLLSMAPVWAAACDGAGAAKGASNSASATTAHSTEAAAKSDGAQCPHMKEGGCKHQGAQAKGEACPRMKDGKGCCCKGKDAPMAEGKSCCKGQCPRAKGVSEKKI